MTIYELVGRNGVPDAIRESVDYFHQGLACYRNQDWEKAEAFFRKAHNANLEDKPAPLYLNRCKACATTELPSDWDGVFVCETK